VLGMLLAVTAGAEAAPTAPGFLLHLLDGTPFDSRESIGKQILVVRFQASYCKPCAKEAAALNRLTERYRDRGVTFVAIHVQDTVDDTRKFVRTHKVAYPVVLDPRLMLGNRFNFKGTPYTVVIDRRGEIAARLVGEGAAKRLPQILDASLKAEPKA